LEEQSRRPKPVSSELWLEAQGPPGIFAIFQEDRGEGYLFAYDTHTKKVLGQVQVYRKQRGLSVRRGDIRVMWSRDNSKCGIAIMGQMRAIIDVLQKRERCVPVESEFNTGIIDTEWLRDFDDYVDETGFLRSRRRYWGEMVRRHSGSEPMPEQTSLPETNFTVYEKGQGNSFGIFEDDGETGYLYIYEPSNGKILQHLHLYDRSPYIDVSPQDVHVTWSSDHTKCGVIIWDQMRGIIDVKAGREGRVWIESRQTPGIGEQSWLAGFQLT